MTSAATAGVIKSLASTLLKKIVSSAAQKDRAAFSIIQEIHPEFEKVHFNYIEIFRNFQYDLRNSELEKVEKYKKKSEKAAIQNFIARRRELEIIRSDLRANIGSLLQNALSENLSKYIFALAIYFLYDEDHGAHPEVVRVFHMAIIDEQNFDKIGDRYFDTPSMRLARKISEAANRDVMQQQASYAIAGLSIKRQNVMSAYFDAKAASTS